ncbi:MAG: hypothetical protein K6U74_07255 [Firmicutes bacterium]|nr:hypothetical protein [Bacillota bacterium]
MGLIPAGAYENRRFLGDDIAFVEGIKQDVKDVLYYPQISGGLLFAVDQLKAGKIIEEMNKNGMQPAHIVGSVIPVDSFLIKVI